MSVLLSIVISTDESLSHFEDTLLSVLENRPSACEVIVAHSQSYQDPYDLSDEVRFVSLPEGSSSIDRLNAGVQCASGEVVHLLRSGIIVSEGWSAAPVSAFDGNLNVGSVTPMLIHMDNPRRVGSIGVGISTTGGRTLVAAGQRILRSTQQRQDSAGPTIDAGFYRTSALRLIGGFRPSTGLWADVDAALRLQAAGYAPLSQPECQLMTKRDRHDRIRGFHAAATSSRMYRRHIGKMSRYPLFVLRDVVRQLPSPQAFLAMLGHAYGAAAPTEQEPPALEARLEPAERSTRRAA